MRAGARSTLSPVVAELLRVEWRMIEDVSVTPCPDGEGYEASIGLNQILVGAAIEQQGLGAIPSSRPEADRRRLAALAECIERVNAKVPATERIRGFQLVD